MHENPQPSPPGDVMLMENLIQLLDKELFSFTIPPTNCLEYNSKSMRHGLWELRQHELAKFKTKHKY